MKIIKILTVNIFFIIIILIISEIIATYYNFKINHKFDGYHHFSKPLEYRYFSLSDFRKPILLPNVTKKDIIIAGCSYVYGITLKDNEIFGAVLSKYSHRNIYSIALNGGSPRDILYVLRNKEILNKLINNKSNAEYFIYVYISDHTNRLYYNNKSTSPFFIPVNNYSKIKYINLPINISSSNLLNYIQLFGINTGINKNRGKLFRLYIKEMKSEIEKQFPNIKFVILVYASSLEKKYFENLNIEGIKIIYVEDINDEIISPKYQFKENDSHPNAKAWQVIVPALVKELNL